MTVQWKNATIFMTKTFDIQTTFTLLKVVQNGAETSQCTVTESSWAIVRTRDRDKRWTPMRVRAYHACVTKLRARKHSKAWRQSQFGQTSACLAEKLTRWKINVANELENAAWKASNSVVFVLYSCNVFAQRSVWIQWVKQSVRWMVNNVSAWSSRENV